MDPSSQAPLTPSSMEEAQAMLERISAEVSQIQTQYNQLQLQAAWLQGWISNQSQQPSIASDAKATTPPNKKARK